MLKLFNTLGRKMEVFRSVDSNVVSVFTCGPSVYQPSHIGNFRTFLFEDILVRYLVYSGYTVRRGMNFTDIEDKAIEEARRSGKSLPGVTAPNIRRFISEMSRLRMKMPDYMPTASDTVDAAAELIARLLDRGVAYRQNSDVYFDPLRFPRFGQLYGLDMTSWPRQKRRYHKDTYPGMRWNRGDFILWHGCGETDACCWVTPIGRGRPAWNIQDAGIVSHYFDETLSVYCGGIDNLIRHHDYSKAILESVRPYPMARYWLHCNHLYVNGKKMSKSLGNIYYVDTLLRKGYSPAEIRFFLVYGHHRDRLHYTDRRMEEASGRLREFRQLLGRIGRKGRAASATDDSLGEQLKYMFATYMDNDLRVKEAFDGMHQILSGVDVNLLSPGGAAGIIKSLREIDDVLRVLF